MVTGNHTDLEHTQGNDLALEIIVGIGSSLSVLGSASIIITTLIFYKLQKHCFSLRLILFISLCDLIISASFLTGIVSRQTGLWSQESKNDSVCIIQAALLQYFAVGSFLWMSCFAHSLWRSVKRIAYNQLKERKQMRKYEIIYHSICWTLPFIPLAILGPLDLFGPTGNWCWISDETRAGDICRFVLFYFPLWVVMVFIFVVYIFVIRKSRDHVIVRRVSLYILVFILLYLPATADRVLNWILEGNGWYWLHVLHVMMQSLQGFLNCIVYGFSLNVIREAIKKLVVPIWSSNEESLLKIDNYNSSNNSNSTFGNSPPGSLHNSHNSHNNNNNSNGNGTSSSGGIASGGDGGSGNRGLLGRHDEEDDDDIIIDEAELHAPLLRNNAIN